MNTFDVEKKRLKREQKKELSIEFLSILESAVWGSGDLARLIVFLFQFCFKGDFGKSVLFKCKNVAEAIWQDHNDFIVKNGDMGD